MRNINCCIFNYAPHYRSSIFELMDENLECDFYMGDKVFSPINKMDYSVLRGFKKELKFLAITKNMYWQKGAVFLPFHAYENYIITGDLRCLSTWVILFLNMLLRKKTFLWTHGFYGDESIVKLFLKRIYFGMSHKVLLYGDYSMRLMISEGLKVDKLVCIYNSLNYDLQKSVLAVVQETSIYQDYFGNDDPVLIYIGRIQRVKKIDMLITAVNSLSNMDIKCNLVIIGDKSLDTDHLHDLVDDSSRVWFYGACYDEYKLCELIWNSDVCVSPGNVGLTAVHSLTYGTPVITHDNYNNQMPEFESIVDGLTGSFFEENSVDSLMDKIRLWIGLNEKERNDVRKNCYKLIDDKYNPHAQMEILTTLFVK